MPNLFIKCECISIQIALYQVSYAPAIAKIREKTSKL